MSNQRAENSYTSLARAPVRLSRFIWLVITVSVMFVTGAGLVLVLFQLSYPTHKTYLGTLRPSQEPLSIQLPAYASLDQILVDFGDAVVSGQVVATLNVEVMEALTQTYAQKILAQTRLLYCLSEKTIPSETNDLDGDTAAQIDAKCRLLLEEHAIKLQILTDQRQILLEEGKILTHFIGLFTLNDRAADTVQAERALALSLARNRISTKVLDIERQIATAILTRNQAIHSETEQVSESILQLTYGISQLRSHIRRPRIHVLRNGTINRIRSVDTAVNLNYGVEIIEVIPEKSAIYVADFNVPIADAQKIPLGSKIEIHLLGSVRFPTPYHGTVSNLSDADGDKINLFIKLEEESILRLADPVNGIALYGRNTVSAIRISQNDLIAGAAILDVVKQVVSNGAKN